MKAKVKATGEIVEVCFSPTNCMEAGGNRWWKTYELDFKEYVEPQAAVIVGEMISKLQLIREKYIKREPVGNEDWVSVASILRENMPLFMYNNPEALRKIEETPELDHHEHQIYSGAIKAQVPQDFQ